MGLFQLQALAGLGLPVLLEQGVVILIHVTGDVVGCVEQGGIGQGAEGGTGQA